jgi:ABC-2 type transport system ATP-binding protein/lipopolysaccharide transport system ATP-binding protein
VLADISVRYRMPTERIATLKEYAVRRVTGRSVKHTEFWALRHVTLEVRRGESIGLIGRNGAGKSTLLKLIARVQKPTSGRVWVKGAVSPLIELGAGFHPELTGRENVYINGAMLGFSRRQMQRKMDSIVEFSGLAHFIDSPIRTYSSGMGARLAFAVVADAEPDILIVDEALAVGDESFQKKCLARMSEFRRQGVTIFYVTHAVGALAETCSRAVWLENGQVRLDGPTQVVVEMYRESLALDTDLAETRKLQIVRVPKRGGSDAH